MSFRHGRNTRVLFADQDISSYLNEVSGSQTLETAETSTFGSNAKTYVVGQNDATISFSGMFDGEEDAIAEIFQDVIDNDSTPAITLAYDNGLGVGNRCSIAEAKQTGFDVSAPIGDVVSLSGEFQVTDGIRQAVLLAAETTDSSSSDGTAVDNSESTAIGARANLHVTANSSDDATTIKVQHSADNSTWADLITFTSVPATTTTSETVSVSGTINQYLRAQSTLAGSGDITYSLSISRREN